MSRKEIGAGEDRDLVATDSYRQRSTDIAETGEVSQSIEFAVAVGAHDPRVPESVTVLGDPALFQSRFFKKEAYARDLPGGATRSLVVRFTMPGLELLFEIGTVTKLVDFEKVRLHEADEIFDATFFLRPPWPVGHGGHVDLGGELREGLIPDRIRSLVLDYESLRIVEHRDERQAAEEVEGVNRAKQSLSSFSSGSRSTRERREYFSREAKKWTTSDRKSVV